MKALGEGAEVLTDDRPRLEFTAPRRQASMRTNLGLVRQHLVPISTWFDLPDRTVAGYLEQLRSIQFDGFTGAKPNAVVERELNAVHGLLYREAGHGDPR